MSIFLENQMSGEFEKGKIHLSSRDGMHRHYTPDQMSIFLGDTLPPSH